MKIRALKVTGEPSDEIMLYDEALPIHFLKSDKTEEEFRPLQVPKQHRKEAIGPQNKANTGTRLPSISGKNKIALGLMKEEEAKQLLAQKKYIKQATRVPNIQAERKPRDPANVLEDEEKLNIRLEDVMRIATEKFEDTVLRKKKMTVDQLLATTSVYRVKTKAYIIIRESVLDFLEKDKAKVKNAKLHAKLRDNLDSHIAVYCISFEYGRKEAKRVLNLLRAKLQEELGLHEND